MINSKCSGPPLYCIDKSIGATSALSRQLPSSQWRRCSCLNRFYWHRLKFLYQIMMKKQRGDEKLAWSWELALMLHGGLLDLSLDLLHYSCSFKLTFWKSSSGVTCEIKFFPRVPGPWLCPNIQFYCSLCFPHKKNLNPQCCCLPPPPPHTHTHTYITLMQL